MNPNSRAKVEMGALALLLALFLWWAYPEERGAKHEPAAASSTPSFIAPIIEAKSAIVYDASTGKTIYDKNAEAVVPLASLTKLMTAFAAAKLLPSYILVRVTADDIRQEGDNGLLVDEEWNVGKLVDYSLMVSSNDGAMAIASVAGAQIAAPTATTSAESLFIARMNQTARELGLSDMRFNNVSGLDIGKDASGGYGSARDVAVLVDKILETEPHLLEATSLSKTVISSKTAAHEADNTNKALSDIPNVIASKTGYTDLSGGNLVVAFNAGLDHPIVITVLGSTYDGRFSDMDALVKATVRYLASTTSETAQQGPVKAIP
jgi:D-alanyl-D-alanine carboxypeptidase